MRTEQQILSFLQFKLNRISPFEFL